jgi:hypothetical protein
VNTNHDEFAGFDVHQLEVLLSDDDGSECEEVLRILEVEDYGKLGSEAIKLANWFRDNGSEEEREVFDKAIQLATFYEMYPKMDRRRGRSVDLRQMQKYDSLRQMLEASDGQEDSLVARLLRSSGDMIGETSELFEVATFEYPKIQIPFDRVAYETFRDNLLEEMIGIRKELTEMAEKTVRAEMEEKVADPNATPEAKQEAQRILESDDVFESCPSLYDAWDKIETMLLRTALEIEKCRSAPYVSVAKSADDLLAEVASCCHATHATVSHVEAENAIRSTLDIAEAIHCLTETIRLSEQHPESLEPESCRLFAEAIRSRNPLELHDALTWIRENLVNRNECMRLLVREAESALHFLLELALQERYVGIRSRLSVAERRLYRFMYRRSPHLNGRIPQADEIGRSFVVGLDVEHAELFLKVIAYRGTPDHVRELEMRWKSYLRLYPFWCELMRFDDREEKRRQKTRYVTSRHEDDLIASPMSDEHEIRLPRDLVDASVESVEALATKYCTDKQRKYIMLAYIDDKTHKDIASIHGVTQQAVSKSIARGLQKIREGIMCDGAIVLATDYREGA